MSLRVYLTFLLGLIDSLARLQPQKTHKPQNIHIDQVADIELRATAKVARTTSAHPGRPNALDIGH